MLSKHMCRGDGEPGDHERQISQCDLDAPFRAGVLGVSGDDDDSGGTSETTRCCECSAGRTRNCRAGKPTRCAAACCCPPGTSSGSRLGTAEADSSLKRVDNFHRRICHNREGDAFSVVVNHLNNARSSNIEMGGDVPAIRVHCPRNIDPADEEFDTIRSLHQVDSAVRGENGRHTARDWVRVFERSARGINHGLDADS